MVPLLSWMETAGLGRIEGTWCDRSERPREASACERASSRSTASNVKRGLPSREGCRRGILRAIKIIGIILGPRFVKPTPQGREYVRESANELYRVRQGGRAVLMSIYIHIMRALLLVATMPRLISCGVTPVPTALLMRPVVTQLRGSVKMQMGWVTGADPSGATYYYNTETGQSQWEPPPAMAAQALWRVYGASGVTGHTRVPGKYGDLPCASTGAHTP